MNTHELLLQLGLFAIAVAANLLSALAGGGAGLVQLPALILLGLPFLRGQNGNICEELVGSVTWHLLLLPKN